MGKIRNLVKWKLEERDQVFAECKRIRLLGPISILDAVRDAQRILPKNRQRKYTGTQQIPPKLMRQLVKLWQDPTMPSVTVPPYTPSPAPQVPSMATPGGGHQDAGADNGNRPETERELSATSEQVGEFATPLAGRPMSYPAGAGDFDGVFKHLCESIGIMLADHVIAAMQQRLRDRAQDVMAEAAETLTKTHSAPLKPYKPKARVIVVGAKGDQARMLENEFKEELDLRIFDQNITDIRLRQASEHARKVVLWTNFVSHHHQNNVPREKLEWVSGGMTKMREKLTEIYVNS